MQPEAEAEKRRVSRVAKPARVEANDDELLRA
jgi:hypothetical protein